MSITWICAVCGYIHEGPYPPEVCPCCRVNSKKFVVDTNNTLLFEKEEDATTWKGHKLADSMSADQIEEYLNTLFEIEKIVHVKRELLPKLKFKCPEKPNPPIVPEEPQHPGSTVITILSVIRLAIVDMLIAGVYGAIVWFVISLFIVFITAFTSFRDKIWGALAILAIIIGIGCFIFTAVMSLKKLSSFKEKQKVYINMKAEYDKEKLKYEKDMGNFLERQLEWEYQVSLWKQECKQLESSLEKSKSNLKQIYAIGVLAPKYRNFIAVCSLFEYFQTGSCETMKEAYNKYDQELLLGHIVTRLDKILNSLDEIKQNQFTLYTAVQVSNQLLGELIQRSDDFYTQTSRQLTNMEQSVLNTDAKISEILQNSAITAYCSEASQEELTLIRRMSQYEGLLGSSWVV